MHIITGLGDGGAEAVLFRLVKHDMLNQHIVVSMMDSGKYGSLLVALKVPVYCLDMPRGRISINGIIKLWNLLSTVKPDVMQTWLYHADLIGGIVARFHGEKNIIWGIHNSTLCSKRSKLSTRVAVRLCALFSYVIPRKIISCSRKAVETHREIGYSKKKFTVIPNGINVNHFSPDIPARIRRRNILHLSDTIPVIGMVARFDWQKDHRNFINALKIIDKNRINFQGILIGPVIKNNKMLIAWIIEAELEKKIFMLDQDDDIPSVMNSLDIHVLSSSYGEAFPNVLVEAMSCGVPCIATDVGDTAFIIGDTGWIVPHSNSQALGDAILEALAERANDPLVWQERQKAARKRISTYFNIERMVMSYNNTWIESISLKETEF